MTRDEFERLLSDWLDEPLRADLHELMKSACEQSPELEALREAWRKSHALTREPPAELRSVDWSGQRARIRATIEAETEAVMAPGARELEGLVELALPTLGIDWQKQREQIAARLDAHIAQELQPGVLDNVLRESDPTEVDWRRERERIAAVTTRRLRVLRRAGWAAGISAAAAVIAFFMLRTPASVPAASDADLAAVVVIDAPAAALADAGGETATFSVSAPEDFDLAAVDPTDESDETSELYFSIEPGVILAAGS